MKEAGMNVEIPTKKNRKYNRKNNRKNRRPDLNIKNTQEKLDLKTKNRNIDDFRLRM